MFTIVDKNSVKNVKLKMNPKHTPIGRRLFVPWPPMVEDKTIGSIGNMQGDNIVTIPAKNAKSVSKIIYYLILANNSFNLPPFHFVTCLPFASICTNVC